MPKVHSAGADRCQRCQAVPSGACSVPALPLRHPQCCPAQATIAPVAVVRSPCAMPICHTRTDRGGEVMQHISSGLKGRRGRGGLSVLPRPPPRPPSHAGPPCPRCASARRRSTTSRRASGRTSAATAATAWNSARSPSVRTSFPTFLLWHQLGGHRFKVCLKACFLFSLTKKCFKSLMEDF